MPNGRVHTLVTTLAAAALSGAALFFSDQIGIDSTAAGIGCLAGILISPDLDLAEDGNISHYYMKKGLGFLPAGLWFLFWWPYGKLMSHRSFLSHFPIVSTLIRILYVLLATWGLFDSWEFWWSFYAFRWGLFGLFVADALHYLMDVVTSEINAIY